MSQIIFDIETGPLPEAAISEFQPEFKAPANYKDPAKIQDYIESSKREWLEGAALSAVTGKVLCIGLSKNDSLNFVLDSDNEEENLRAFWDEFSQPSEWIGWNVRSFDVPFLIRRSWSLGVRVPRDVFDGHYLTRKVVDLMSMWGCGNYGERFSLDNASRFLRVGEKNGSGSDFARLWAEDREQAYEYLKNDLRLTRELAKRMGVIEAPQLEQIKEAL